MQEVQYRMHLLQSHAKTSIPQPLFIEMPVPIVETERLCICVFGVSIEPLATIFDILFWNCSDSVVFCLFFLLCYCSISNTLLVQWS